MNTHQRIVIPNAPRYEDDCYGWALAQAELLRAGRLSEIDVENIAEEIEALSRSEYRAAESALRVLLLHLLKWSYQPERRTSSWVNTILEQQEQFEEELSDNPSLRPRRDEMLKRAYLRARRAAARETRLPLNSFPEQPPGWPDILDVEPKLDA